MRTLPVRLRWSARSALTALINALSYNLSMNKMTRKTVNPWLEQMGGSSDSDGMARGVPNDSPGTVVQWTQAPLS